MSASNGIKGLIFDLDGVITDTAEYHYRSWQQMADEEGLPFDRQKNERLRGVSRAESLRRLLDGREVAPEKFQEMMDRKNDYYNEAIKQFSPNDFLPGAKELLQAARAAGLKIAIASSSRNAQTVVDLLQMRDAIDALTDGHMVKNPKPAPDLFVHAAGQLRLSVHECIVFEDAEAGVEAGVAAGMKVVGLGPMELVGGADVVLPNLAGTTLEGILAAAK